MHIKRIFTHTDSAAGSGPGNASGSGQTGPYDQLTFRRVNVTLPDGAAMDVTAPSSWPVSAVEAFAAHALLLDWVPLERRQIRERGCPKTLRRHVPLEDGSLPLGSETDIRAALNRVAGGLARTGWDHGYFDRESDALDFEDELRASLVQRRATLSANCWQSLGLSWAYGAEETGPSFKTAGVKMPGVPDADPSAQSEQLAHQLDDASALAMGRAMLADMREEIDAAVQLGGPDVATNPHLRSALATAAQRGLPATAARRLVDLSAAHKGTSGTPDTHLDFDSDIWTIVGMPEPQIARLNGIRKPELDALSTASYGGTAPRVVLEHHMRATDLGTLHGDDTPMATINAAACMMAEGKSSLDIDAIVHVVRLLTIALDIARGDQPSDAHRPVAINIANVAPVIMSHGMPYGLDEGRGLAATFSALVTATALATSADMAAHMCPAPAFSGQEDEAGRFMRNMQRALLGQAAGYEGLAHTPQALYPYTPDQARVLDAARAVLDKAMARYQQSGLRSLVLTGVTEDAVAADLLAAETPGIGPMKTLVHYRRLTPDFDGSAIYKVISSAVPRALRALQHDDAQIDRLIDYVIGHGSLAEAPGVNHDLLRERGFTDDDIEITENLLATAANIRGVFTPYVLGWDDVFEEDDDVLTRLGFSEWDVEHANFYCCGALTLEGARGLPLEHLPVFDCEKPLGRIGARHVSIDDRMKMAQAIQPFVTDTVMLDLELPQETPLDDIVRLYQTADSSGLKSICLNRAGTDLTEPLSYDELLGSETHMDALAGKIQVRTVESDIPAPEPAVPADLATAISIGLEHGVPLEAYAAAFGGDTRAAPAAFADALRAIATGYLDTAALPSVALNPLRDTDVMPTHPETTRTIPHSGSITRSPHSRTGIRRATSAPHASPASGASALSPPSVSGRHREE